MPYADVYTERILKVSVTAAGVASAPVPAGRALIVTDVSYVSSGAGSSAVVGAPGGPYFSAHVGSSAGASTHWVGRQRFYEGESVQVLGAAGTTHVWVTGYMLVAP